MLVVKILNRFNVILFCLNYQIFYFIIFVSTILSTLLLKSQKGECFTFSSLLESAF